MSASVSRRELLRGAAGGAVLASMHALPAWARVAGHGAHRRHALRRPGSLPFPRLPAGTESMHEIRHVVVAIMENHSFDNLLGMVPHRVRGRGGVDGLTVRRGHVTNSNPDPHGRRVHAAHASSPCQLPHEPTQSWNASHHSFDRGRNDGFVLASGPIAMRFWDERDLPFTYSLVRHFPVGERFFCSVLGPTYPNRRFFFTGTASGTIATDATTFSVPAANGTIWDRLDAHRVDWGIYFQNLPSWAIVPGSTTPARASRVRKFEQFASDVAGGRLPQFTFLDPDYNTTSEENPQDVQVGEQFLSFVTRVLMEAESWKHTALFITYDEHGGYYDHVPPPRAIRPDSIPPRLRPGDVRAGYDRYGFRVPLIVVSPWARPGYSSRVTQDLTSLTAFIERKWNLPAMTFRDANAHPMTDYFDFRRAAFAKPPGLHRAPGLGAGLRACNAHGLQPPLPGTGGASAASDVTRYLRR